MRAEKAFRPSASKYNRVGESFSLLKPTATRNGGGLFTNTENKGQRQCRTVGSALSSPEGPGWSGYKPLMRNRTATTPLPTGYTVRHDFQYGYKSPFKAWSPSSWSPCPNPNHRAAWNTEIPGNPRVVRSRFYTPETRATVFIIPKGSSSVARSPAGHAPEGLLNRRCR